MDIGRPRSSNGASDSAWFDEIGGYWWITGGALGTVTTGH